MNINREKMNIVVVGHVDHGKSTVIGRLLADTGSLPEGKLEQVKATCAKNSKPFEYAFLLDALKDEQAQGITIDSARCFFKTKKRDYIIIDAPGHIEFLKNMVTGAAHAESALLVIDAKEGIRENSKRHGHMVSMLGVKQVSVLVNKLDLVDYDRKVFDDIQREYTVFLRKLNVIPVSFIPISALMGDNIAARSGKTGWYSGPTVLEQLDGFSKQAGKEELPFRFPVQDIYKFTEDNDERRIVAGTIESGKVKKGDSVIFLPSYKESTVKSVEAFNSTVRTESSVGEAAGFTLDTQIYIRPGELMVKKGEQAPKVSSTFKANIFWVGKAPLVKNKTYKLKLASTRVTVKLADVINVLDASELTTVTNKEQVDRHDVAECIFEASRPIAFDIVSDIETMGRIVIVDNYEIAGGGIIIEALSVSDSILKKHIKEREGLWEAGSVTVRQREKEYKHKPKFVVFTASAEYNEDKTREIAKAVEERLFRDKYKVYYLGLSNLIYGIDSDVAASSADREEHIRRLGELARIFTDSGQIFITTIFKLDDYEVAKLKLLNEPNEILVINSGESNFNKFAVNAQLAGSESVEEAVETVLSLLKKHDIVLEYYL